ncbi:secreted protein [Pyrenochaeta sp. MPI-SDFR-AT-0127]|nr:secreted protein [Pyrenochaeta sp. MPI-SDFR-AT-0127]
MRLFTKPSTYLLALLTLTTPTLAAWNNLTLSNYKLAQSGYSSAIANLDSALPNVKVSDIIADLNHNNPSTTPSVKNLIPSSAYGWQNTADFNDQDTEKWYPQGVTTSADAYDSGTYEGFRVQLISWHSDHYDDGKRGARVSFVSGTKYRHVLLVIPKGKDDFEAIKGLHAGGIMWYGSLVYVVDTTGGLRVFDLNHIYKVDPEVKEGIGRQTGGAFGAYGYKYVLPQVRTYDWQPKSGLIDMRFSFISLDRTTTPDSILVGEYSATRTDCRLVRWDIDYTNRLLKTSNGIATASEAVSHGNTKIQGAASINGKWFLTQSGGDLISYSWKDGKKTTADTFPKVPEDLSYEKGVGLWTLMEVPGSRNVFAIDPAKF